MGFAIAPWLFALLGLYLYLYPWSVLLVALDMVPAWGAWMGGLLLIVQGTVLGLWLTVNYGWRGVLVSLLILVLSWAVEHIGVLTGFPFGSYVYTDVLGMKIFGVVPLAVPFAWLLVVPASIGVIEWLFRRGTDERPQPRTRRHTLLKMLGAASLALLLDVGIEPVSVYINNYWVWGQEIHEGFYGVPAENFVAWWVTSFMLAGVYYAILPPASRSSTPATQRTRHLVAAMRGAWLAFLAQPLAIKWRTIWQVCNTPGTQHPAYNWLPPLFYLLTLVLLMITNLAHGKLEAGAIGALVLGYLVLVYLEPRLEQWIMQHAPQPAAEPLEAEAQRNRQ
ncbi:MAG: carotenoid biosynthesis protein [Chloroflexaceae bacterium]|nr:carotenoid biosynthesis protein [Chloroflexaceae bacterium]